MRARHTRRHPGPASYHTYPWSGLISCRSCGRRITGHGGRYRHVEACAAFQAARPAALADRRGKGDSYKAQVYDSIAPRALTHVVASAELVAEVNQVIEELTTGSASQFSLARIARDRRDATRRLEAHRDVAFWQATMNRLDAEQAEARALESPRPSSSEVASALADMAHLYSDASPQTQHRILQALFERMEVLGPNEVWLTPSLEAEERGWAAAMRGEFRMKERRTGRGERTQASRTDQLIRVHLVGAEAHDQRSA